MKNAMVLMLGLLALVLTSCGEDAATQKLLGDSKTQSDTSSGQAAETTIDVGPAELVNQRSATFEFSCDQDACSYECQLAGGDWVACTSPHQTVELDDGEYTFSVRASNAAGVVDATPAEWTWTIDTTEPKTVIQSAPPAWENASGARFTFGCNEAKCSFECSLDGAEWAPCKSPVTYRQLEHGAHTFTVRARDEIGNLDAAPPVWDWVADLSGAHWVSIPAGTFLMGNHPDRTEEEIPDLLDKGYTFAQLDDYLKTEYPHYVTLTSDFDVYAYPVTNGEYEACVTAGECTPPGDNAATYGYGASTASDARRPILYVDWGQANTFCGWLGGRLPTEAEWEYFARGGEADLRFAKGNTITCDDANYSTSNSWFYDVDPQGSVACVGSTTVVGTYSANGFGIYDLVGNVSEWVHDWYDSRYFVNAPPTDDPQGPDSGTNRTRRGGHYADSAQSIRISARAAASPSTQNMYIGFRCVR